MVTDPCFEDLPFIKRLVPLPCDPDNIKNVDFILLSHGHRDHLDIKSLKRLYSNNINLKAIVPLKIGNLIKEINEKAEITEFAWYQCLQINEDIKIIFMPAVHWHKRGLNDFNKMLWGSFMIQYQGLNIFFAGDTAFSSFFKEIKNLFGEIDYCILPIGAYKPQSMMKASHMCPQEAVQAFNILGGKKFIPMHYGTYDVSDEPLGEPIQLLRKLYNQGKINGNLCDLDVGEVLEINI